MEIEGKVIQILEPVTGEGRNGPWKKQEFIIETQDQYPKKVCIAVWGDKIDLTSFSENEMVKVYVNVESREFNERWYTDVKAWKAEKMGQEEVPETEGSIPTADFLPDANPEEPDDLPF